MQTAQRNQLYRSCQHVMSNTYLHCTSLKIILKGETIPLKCSLPHISTLCQLSLPHVHKMCAFSFCPCMLFKKKHSNQFSFILNYRKLGKEVELREYYKESYKAYLVCHTFYSQHNDYKKPVASFFCSFVVTPD